MQLNKQTIVIFDGGIIVNCVGWNTAVFLCNKVKQISYLSLICHHSYGLCFILQAFGCIDQDRDGVIKKQDLKETYAQLGIFSFSLIY